MRVKFLSVLVCLAFCSVISAQTQSATSGIAAAKAGRLEATAGQTGGPALLPAQEQSPAASNPNSLEAVAKEIELLRKSVTALNTRLREITERSSAPGNAAGSATERQSRLAANLDLLTKAEQRAESMRKQLLELIEKETSLKGKLVQLDEDSRPDNVERSLAGVGTTRTVELRDARRRVLENDKRGSDSLLSQVSQARVRLEEDLRQADAMVTRLRQRVLPQIEREIEKLNPN